MPNQVTYFEVTGKDGAALQKFYSSAFGWKIDPAPVPGYGFVHSASKVQVRGGIGTAPPHSPSGVKFYVQTEDMKATLRKIEKSGGKVLMPPTEIGGTTIALFADPEGHVVGLL
jgi:predicted enzyme related to lactoylglutathione lyase